MSEFHRCEASGAQPHLPSRGGNRPSGRPHTHPPVVGGREGGRGRAHAKCQAEPLDKEAAVRSEDRPKESHEAGTVRSLYAVGPVQD